LKSGVVAVLRSLGGCLGAGLVVGIVVAGLGSRLVMRLLAVADPDARGIITENGNVVGDITFGERRGSSSSSASRRGSSPA
jgi:hypothetical protein